MTPVARPCADHVMTILAITRALTMARKFAWLVGKEHTVTKQSAWKVVRISMGTVTGPTNANVEAAGRDHCAQSVLSTPDAVTEIVRNPGNANVLKAGADSFVH